MVDTHGPRSLSDGGAIASDRDGGGSNGSRVRLWKVALQNLPTKLDLIFRYAIFLPEQQMELKLSIGCLAISA